MKIFWFCWKKERISYFFSGVCLQVPPSLTFSLTSFLFTFSCACLSSFHLLLCHTRVEGEGHWRARCPTSSSWPSGLAYGKQRLFVGKQAGWWWGGRCDLTSAPYWDGSSAQITLTTLEYISSLTFKLWIIQTFMLLFESFVYVIVSQNVS